MPKIKAHTHAGGKPASHYHVAHHNHSDMDKVKIKRVKRARKKTTTGEKVLAGLGVGSTLLGGVGAVAPKEAQTQFVREQPAETDISRSNVKDTIKRIFGSTFGVQSAKAAGTASVSLMVNGQPSTGIAHPGDQFTVYISGADPNAAVSVSGGVNGAQSTTRVGTTDASGNFSFSGSWSSSDIGDWSMSWIVGGQVVGSMGISLQAAEPAASGGSLAFSTSSGNTTSVKAGDTWTVNIQGATPNSPVYVVGGLNGAQDKTPSGNTDSNGNFSTSGTFSASDAGSWSEQWLVGDQVSGSFSFNLQAAAATASAVSAGSLAFTTSSGSSNTVNAGDSWTIKITGATPGAAVSVVGGKNGAQDNTPAGTVQQDGTFQTSGTFTAADAGSWAETWMVGGQESGNITFNVAAAASTTQVAMNLIGPDQSWGMTGVNNDVMNWLAAHPDAAAGTVTVNKDAQGNITSYIIAGTTYTPAQLASAIVAIGQQMYGQSIADGLNSLTPEQQAVYLLGTSALTFPGTPNVYLPQPWDIMETGTVTFTAPSTATMTSGTTGQSTGGLSALTWTTLAQAQAALAQVQITHPDAKLVDSLSNFVGFTADYGTDGRRSWSIAYAGTDGQTINIDAFTVLGQMNIAASSGGSIVSSGNLTFSTSAGSTANVKAGDTWTVNIQSATPNTIVYAVGGLNGAQDKTPMGTTDANGNFSASGTFTGGEAGVWSETWMVGDRISGSFNFTLPAVTATPTLLFTKNGGNTSTGTVTVGDTWSINISNAPANSPVYVIGGKIASGVTPTDKTPMGTIDANGNFSASGIFAAGDAGTWSETWLVGAQTVGTVSFNLVAAPTTASTAQVDLNLISPNQNWGLDGVNVMNWLAAHPDAAAGTVTVNKDAQGNIISYVIAGTTYTPTQLAAAITDIGKQLYGHLEDGLNSLTPQQQAVYFLGTSALTLPGTPYVYLPPVWSSMQTGITTFTAPGTAQTISGISGDSTSGISPLGWVTPAQADAALAQIQKFHPDAKLSDPYTNFAGFTVDFGTDTRRPYDIVYTDANGNQMQIDVNIVLNQMGTSGILTSDVTAGIVNTGRSVPTGSLLSTASSPAATLGGTAPIFVDPLGTVPSPVSAANGTTGIVSGTGATGSTAGTTNAAQTAGTTLSLSSQNVNLNIGTSTVVTSTVTTNGQVNHRVNAIYHSSFILVNINQTTGAITLIGLAPGTASITIHPADLPASDASQDKIITVSVTSQDSVAFAPAASLNDATSVLADADAAANDSGAETLADTSAAAATGASTVIDTNTASGTGNVVNSDQQITTQLRQQITDLQSRIDSLNGQLVNTASGQPADTTALKTQITGLKAQVAELSQTVSQLQSGQIHILGSADQLQGLQMPAGYSASGAGQTASGQIQGAQTLGTYTVKKSDTLWNIARKYYGDGTKWRKILSANPNSLSQAGNTKTLKVGAVLNIPNLN